MAGDTAHRHVLGNFFAFADGGLLFSGGHFVLFAQSNPLFIPIIAVAHDIVEGANLGGIHLYLIGIVGFGAAPVGKDWQQLLMGYLGKNGRELVHLVQVFEVIVTDQEHSLGLSILAQLFHFTGRGGPHYTIQMPGLEIAL